MTVGNQGTNGHQMSRVCVVGAGYVGLVTGACLARLGHSVVCLETDQQRLHELKNGRSPIHEPGLADLVTEGMNQGRLRFADDYREVANVTFAFIAVPTPPREDGSADTSYVHAAVNSVFGHASKDLVVVIKSTVPVGTGDEIASQARAFGKRLEVVSNPEFLKQGAAVKDFLEPDRVVIGACSMESAHRVAELYSALQRPVLIVSRRSAELAKYTANALLATRISFMNEISHIATAVGADVDDISKIVGLDRRIGPSFLKAGLGWGGSCFPKDILALSNVAQMNGCATPILSAVYLVNENQRGRAVDLLLDATRHVAEPVVALLGLAFKPETDDVRGSPALEIARRLIAAGVTVRGHDPQAVDNASRVLPELNLLRDPYEAVAGADAILLATDWERYEHLDWTLIREAMRGKVVVDGRNVLDPGRLAKLGFEYAGFGRSAAQIDSLRSQNGHTPSMWTGV